MKTVQEFLKNIPQEDKQLLAEALSTHYRQMKFKAMVREAKK